MYQKQILFQDVYCQLKKPTNKYSKLWRKQKQNKTKQAGIFNLFYEY